MELELITLRMESGPDGRKVRRLVSAAVQSEDVASAIMEHVVKKACMGDLAFFLMKPRADDTGAGDAVATVYVTEAPKFVLSVLHGTSSERYEIPKFIPGNNDYILLDSWELCH